MHAPPEHAAPLDGRYTRSNATRKEVAVSMHVHAREGRGRCREDIWCREGMKTCRESFVLFYFSAQRKDAQRGERWRRSTVAGMENTNEKRVNNSLQLIPPVPVYPPFGPLLVCTSSPPHVGPVKCFRRAGVGTLKQVMPCLTANCVKKRSGPGLH